MKTKSHSHQKSGMETQAVNDKTLSDDISKEQECEECWKIKDYNALVKDIRKDAIKEIIKLIDSEIENEKSYKKTNIRGWTYEQELEYLKERIKKELK
jgi:hypothetical protein